VLITSLTTMVGFGCLMMADHRGLQSLGRVLVIGVTCCLFTSLVPLPALLAWITRNRPEEPGEMGAPAGPREHAATGRDGASGRKPRKVDLAMPIH
jgi:predicted RND superfamily exporter protein